MACDGLAGTAWRGVVYTRPGNGLTRSKAVMEPDRETGSLGTKCSLCLSSMVEYDDAREREGRPAVVVHGFGETRP